MKAFSEEKKTGTLEALLTRPISQHEIIIAKYLSCLFLVVVSILPTLVYYVSIYKLGSPIGNVDTPGVIGSYIGLVLLSGAFVGLGIFTSSLSENQIVAFILAVFLCFIMYSGLYSLAEINPWAELSIILEQLSILYHYDALSRGLLDLQNAFYLILLSIISILSTDLIIKSRNW